MRLAAAGVTKRRASPIRVARRGDGYAILDGNATYGLAVRHGWQDLPAPVQEDAGPRGFHWAAEDLQPGCPDP